MNHAPRFELGSIDITEGAIDKIHPMEIGRGLDRHLTGNHGECSGVVLEANTKAVGGALQFQTVFSIYRDDRGNKFIIVTELEHRITTIALVDQYLDRKP